MTREEQIRQQTDQDVEAFITSLDEDASSGIPPPPEIEITEVKTSEVIDSEGLLGFFKFGPVSGAGTEPPGGGGGGITVTYPGGCCYPDGSCIDTVSTECDGGVFHSQQACAELTCPVEPSGACCNYPDACAVVRRSQCYGTYFGDGTSCSGVECGIPYGCAPGHIWCADQCTEHEPHTPSPHCCSVAPGPSGGQTIHDITCNCAYEPLGGIYYTVCCWMFNGFSACEGVVISDRQLKENIEKVGVTANGFNIYEYNLKGSTQRERGLMADEVLWAVPTAVFESDGVLVIDYENPNIDMKPEIVTYGLS